MPDEHKVINDLRQCMRAANGDPNKMAACQATFEKAGGTVSADGGKVFSLPNGDKAFVTTGGKVF